MSSSRYVAFLRGMNLGRRRLTNDTLIAAVESLGFEDVSTFLASGNVTLTAGRQRRDRIQSVLEEGLEEQLGYEVPIFLRTAAEVRAIAAARPFADEAGADGGKPQVALLAQAPDGRTRRRALSLATADDRLAIDGTELHWLPRGRLSDSELDLRALEKTLGRMTIRTQQTIARLADRVG